MSIGCSRLLQPVHKFLSNTTHYLSTFDIPECQKRKSASQLTAQITVSFH